MSRSDSVVPDLSSASERVSEIVSTAMSSGTNFLDSSMEDIALYSSCPGPGAASFTLLRSAGTHSQLTFHGPRISRAPANALRRVRGTSTRLQITRAEGIAGLHRALLIAGHEPLLSLRGGTVGKRIRHHPPGRLPLQRIVADRRCRGQRCIDVAGFEEARALLLFAVDPDARQTIRLQLDPHLQRVGLRLAAGLLLQPRHARQDAEQVLDMMPGFMGDDIGRGEFAGIARAAAKPRLDLTEESGIEKNLLVRRAVERPHRRLRHAAAPAIGGVAKQHDARTRIGLTAGLEDLAPAIVDLAEDAGDHVAHLVGRRTGLGGRGPAIGLIARRLSATGKNLRAADQDARIDAEGVTDETEHDDVADAEAAAAHRKSDAAATAAAIIAATIIDVVAAAEVIVTHGDFSSFRLAGSELADTQRANHVKFPLRYSITRPAKIA